MSIIMENAMRGVNNQEELAEDAIECLDFALAEEHLGAAKLLRSFSADYFPCLEGEL